MIERVVGWAIQKVVEDVDDSLTTAALLGVALDTAAFKAIGLPGASAIVAGAVSGAGPRAIKKMRAKSKEN